MKFVENPVSPNTITGQTIPENVKGITRYVTNDQNSSYHAFLYASILSAVAYMVLFLYFKYKNKVIK